MTLDAWPTHTERFGCIDACVAHNIGRATLTADGRLDSHDGGTWWQMGGNWYFDSATYRYPTLVSVPSTIAALDARWAEVGAA